MNLKFIWRFHMRLISKIKIISLLGIPFILLFSINSEADSKRNTHKIAKSLFIMQKVFDANNDGNISKTEMTSKAKNTMHNYDENKDNALSLEEYKKLWIKKMNRRMVRHFQRLDQDGNAMVSLEEINNGMDRIMWRMDRNNDNVISKDDLLYKRVRGRINKFSNRPG